MSGCIRLNGARTLAAVDAGKDSASPSDQKTDSQEHELRSYCQRRGWSSIQTFADQISGAKFGRRGLEAMLAAVRAGKIDRVVVYKLDRLGRSLTHLALILDELQREPKGSDLGF